MVTGKELDTGTKKLKKRKMKIKYFVWDENINFVYIFNRFEVKIKPNIKIKQPVSNKSAGNLLKDWNVTY